MYKGKIKSALASEFGGMDDSSGKFYSLKIVIKTMLIEYNDAYSNLSKSTLVQESNIFNEKNLSVGKCVDLLNKIIFLLNQVNHNYI